MYVLNGLLLLVFAFALERTFNAGVSLGHRLQPRPSSDRIREVDKCL